MQAQTNNTIKGGCIMDIWHRVGRIVPVSYTHLDVYKRQEKTRHTERNRTVEDLLKNNKTCPEESIYQIGTLEECVPPETLFRIVNEFSEEFERRFGSHIHILD